MAADTYAWSHHGVAGYDDVPQPRIVPKPRDERHGRAFAAQFFPREAGRVSTAMTSRGGTTLTSQPLQPRADVTAGPTPKGGRRRGGQPAVPAASPRPLTCGAAQHRGAAAGPAQGEQRGGEEHGLVIGVRRQHQGAGNSGFPRRASPRGGRETAAQATRDPEQHQDQHQDRHQQHQRQTRQPPAPPPRCHSDRRLTLLPRRTREGAHEGSAASEVPPASSSSSPPISVPPPGGAAHRLLSSRAGQGKGSSRGTPPRSSRGAGPLRRGYNRGQAHLCGKPGRIGPASPARNT